MSIKNKKDDQFKEKKITWSKGLLLCSGLIFVGTLIFVVNSPMSTDPYGTTVMVALLTITGTIFATISVWYSKKAASENHYKLRMNLFRDAAEVRLKYNQEMMKTMKRLGFTEEDMCKVNETGDMDEFMDNALGDVVSDLDHARDEFDSDTEIQNVGM